MSLLMAFSIVLIVLSLGDIISTKTKAFIPSVFCCCSAIILNRFLGFFGRYC